MNTTAAAVLFLTGFPLIAIAVGVALLVLQTIAITTHFCTLGWMYEGLMRALGLWKVSMDLGKARTLVNDCHSVRFDYGMAPVKRQPSKSGALPPFVARKQIVCTRARESGSAGSVFRGRTQRWKSIRQFSTTD